MPMEILTMGCLKKTRKVVLEYTTGPAVTNIQVCSYVVILLFEYVVM